MKMKKYTPNQLNGKLGNRKDICIILKEKEEETVYNIEIRFWRADLIEKNYPKETYILTIQKYDSRYYSSDTTLLVDKRLEFHTVEEVLDYLDKNNFVKKEDLIKNE